MGSNKNWSKEELLYLEESWGTVSVETISKKLNRSVNAIYIKARKLELGPFLLGGEYITFNQLVQTITGHNSDSYQNKSWIKNRKFPIHYKKINEKRVKIVYLDEFWEWAEKNRNFIDFSKMEPLSLGKEPEWVDEQRRKDYKAFSLQRKDPWTAAEDAKLLYLLEKQEYGYKELSAILHRSAGAIQRRCTDLGTKYRPVKADNHSAESAWTDEDYEILAEGIKNGDSYTVIGNMLDKSEKAVRAKVYFVYLTESADKVRVMLGDGKWGDGAPDVLVKQGVHLSRCRSETRRNLSTLAGILKYRMNQLGYDPYFQRFMCMNWDDFEGCSAGGTDCDACLEFKRIRPQYCARCGGTFYERKENRFCEACRTAKKKQAQKKWCALNKKAG